MCGIAGIVSPSGREFTSEINRMVEAMQHRGPDGNGVHVSRDRQCHFGHTRLSILDVSDAAAQPVVSDSGSQILTYNGEIYNHLELRDRLSGYEFRSHSDTATVSALLEAEGADALESFSGMFGLGLWDEREQSLLLARDRFGIKPLYYATLPCGGIVFASEVRAILESGLVERKVSMAALSRYLAYGFVSGSETIVEGVYSLTAGCALSWSLQRPETVMTPFVADRGAPDSSAFSPRELAAGFEEAISSHLLSDVPVGAFLSGGVDSSAVLAAMARVSGSEANALTVSFPDAPGMSEHNEAESWAREIGVGHQTIPVTIREILETIPLALAAQDQPSSDGPNTYIVSRAARQAGLTVSLSGLGGDEFFGGYPVFHQVPKALKVRRALGPASPLVSGSLNALSPWTHRRLTKLGDLLSAPAAVAGQYAARRRQFAPLQIHRLLPGTSPDLGLSSQIPPDVTEDLDQISWLETRTYMSEQLLRDSDAMGMANHLEIRVPFLDNAFSDLAWNAGSGFRDGKHAFAAAIPHLLPGDMMTRRKRGFTMPFEQWMQVELRDMVDERLRALPDFFCKRSVMKLWSTFLKHPDQVGWTRPWSLYCLSEYLVRHRLMF